MSQAEIVITALLVAVVGLSALARVLSVPYPIMLVIGGAVLGFVPGLPEIKLNPAIVLVVFLPPLLYGSAIFANVTDFRADLRWLALNTVRWCSSRSARSRWSRTHSSPGCRGLPRSSSERSCHPPTRWPRGRSCAASAPHGASSAQSRAKACSTTPPRSSPTGSRSPLSWPAASHSLTRA